jgi:hypothetical protein
LWVQTVSITDDPFETMKMWDFTPGMALVSKVRKYGMYLHFTAVLELQLRCFCFSRYCIPNYKRVKFSLYTFFLYILYFRLPLKIPPLDHILDVMDLKWTDKGPRSARRERAADNQTFRPGA